MRAMYPEFRAAYRSCGRFAESESGSLTIFTLFLFIILLMMSGMAVDLIRAEHGRVRMQNTLDTAVVAASSLDQTMDAETVVREYVTKAGYDASQVHVNVTDSFQQGSMVLTNRQVSASTYVHSPTMFMDLMGVDILRNTAGGTAMEAAQKVEISLILDMSDSMNLASSDPSKTKIAALQQAAKDFVDSVFATNDPSNVSISIVPYNHQVYVPDSLMAQLSVNDKTTEIKSPPSYPGTPVTTYQTSNPAAPCVVFEDADFQSLDLTADGTVTRSASFLQDMYGWGRDGVTQMAFEEPHEWAKWCGHAMPKIMPYSNDPTALKTYIDDFVADGATAIHYGMKWGVALLNPDFSDEVSAMVKAGDLPAAMNGLPGGWGNPDVVKYVILMTDGENTNFWDLDEPYKSGPTRVWYSDASTGGTTTYNETIEVVNADGTITPQVNTITADLGTYNGYFVEMPDNPADQRWYRPNLPTTTADDEYLAEADLPADSVQLDYHGLYQRFGVRSAARFFFQHSDPAAYTEHFSNQVQLGWGQAVTQNRSICDQAKTNANITIFTVAFEAPVNGQELLEYCATAPGYYFDVDGTDIGTAFKSIAGQIALLRLTE